MYRIKVITKVFICVLSIQLKNKSYKNKFYILNEGNPTPVDSKPPSTANICPVM